MKVGALTDLVRAAVSIALDTCAIYTQHPELAANSPSGGIRYDSGKSVAAAEVITSLDDFAHAMAQRGEAKYDYFVVVVPCRLEE